MAKNNNLGDFLTDIANTIRTKKGTSGTINAQDFSNEIASISGGASLLTNTVTFNVDNTDYAIHSVASGTIEAPTLPTKSGYVFKGWGDSSSASSFYSFPYTPTQTEKTMYAVWLQETYGSISGLGSSNPSSVSFNVPNDLFTGIREETKNGNVFIRIPKMYRSIVATSSGQITSIRIANAKIDSSYHIYPCFLKEDGVTEMDYILIGKYCVSSTTIANSVNATAVSMTIDAGRTLCSNLGSGYQQMDWQIFKLWQDLLIAKMQTVNTNGGSGIETDVFGIVWKQQGSNQNPWVDGVTHNATSKQYIFSYKPSQYVNQATTSTTGYQATSYTYSGTSGQEVSKLGYDSSHEFFNYPVATVNNSSYNTYYCDAVWWGTSGTNPVYSFVGGTGARCGAFFCDADVAWTSAVGVRLCYRPLAS